MRDARGFLRLSPGDDAEDRMGGAMPVSPVAYGPGVAPFTQAEELALWAQVGNAVQNGARGGGGNYWLAGTQYNVQWQTQGNGIVVTAHQP
jgi:hypothetical protein